MENLFGTQLGLPNLESSSLFTKEINDLFEEKNENPFVWNEIDELKFHFPFENPVEAIEVKSFSHSRDSHLNFGCNHEINDRSLFFEGNTSGVDLHKEQDNLSQVADIDTIKEFEDFPLKHDQKNWDSRLGLEPSTNGTTCHLSKTQKACSLKERIRFSKKDEWGMLISFSLFFLFYQYQRSCINFPSVPQDFCRTIAYNSV